MKKFILISFLFLALSSCQKEFGESIPADTEHPLSNEVMAHHVSIEEAEANVVSFLSEFRGATKASEPIAITSKFSKGGFGYATKSDPLDEQPLVYIFNIGDGDGFIIASGDDRVPQILCMLDKGSFAEDEELTNPSMITLLSMIDTDYRMAVGLPIIDGEGNTVLPEQYGYRDDSAAPATKVNGVAYYDTTPWVINTSIGTIIPCSWKQQGYFNDKCFTPDGVEAYAGCLPIAVAQVMYHWGVNTTYNGVYYDWSLMQNILDNNTPYYANYTAWDKVQSLVAALGDSNNLAATYHAPGDGSGSGTSAPLENIARTFQHFGYISGGTTTDYSLSGLRSALSVGPVLGYGCSYKTVKVTKILGIVISTQTSYSGAHEWVYDNVIDRSCMRFGYDGNNVIIFAESLNETLVHCNFGWGDNSNGYYYSGDYNTNSPVTRSITETTYGSAYYYQYLLKMTTDIHPYAL